jgi:hypothetical protein
MYPEAKSVAGWLKAGWPIAVGYVVGFLVWLAVLGWQPHDAHDPAMPPAAGTSTTSGPR